jgi:Protein of unknown function (DUF3465)
MLKGEARTFTWRSRMRLRARGSSGVLSAVIGTVRDWFRRSDALIHGQMVIINGVVIRTLADDRDGSPHQRFILKTNHGITLMIAHNLDLAPRLNGLAAGDKLRVRGEYVWNERGGALHWTHDDPRGDHEPGYIDWDGKRYQ